MIVYAAITTDSVVARGLVNGRCLPRSGRRDILSVVITAFIFIGVILRIIVSLNKRNGDSRCRFFVANICIIDYGFSKS